MSKKLKSSLKMFGLFFKIGLFTFGGGYAMIPLIQREIVEKRELVTDDDILEIVAIAESTPGPIAINSATFIGYKVCGFWGSFFATLGVVTPSFLILLAISHILREFQELKVIKYAFNGIRAGVLALIVKALYTMYKKTKKYLFAYIIMAAAFVLSAFVDINVLFIIIGCGIAGLVYSLIAEKKSKKGDLK